MVPVAKDRPVGLVVDLFSSFQICHLMLVKSFNAHKRGILAEIWYLKRGLKQEIKTQWSKKGPYLIDSDIVINTGKKSLPPKDLGIEVLDAGIRTMTGSESQGIKLEVNRSNKGRISLMGYLCFPVFSPVALLALLQRK